MNRTILLLALLAGGLTLLVSPAVAQLNPTITSVNPNEIIAGAGDTTINVYGSTFQQTGASFGAHVYWNNTLLPTTWISTFQLQALVPAALLTTPGTAAVTVHNIPTGGQDAVSNTVNVQIIPPLTISSLNPPSIPIGVTECTLGVAG